MLGFPALGVGKSACMLTPASEGELKASKMKTSGSTDGGTGQKGTRDRTYGLLRDWVPTARLFRRWIPATCSAGELLRSKRHLRA
eukprot:3571163-Amphidinium_carterae.2